MYDLRPLLRTEFNIEGYPTPEFMDLVTKVKPAQVTLVPDAPDALTSSAGWDVETHADFLAGIVDSLRDAGIRTSIFVAPDVDTIRAAARVGADRVELYTKPYADRYATDPEVAVAPLSRRAGPPIMQVWASMPDMISASGILLSFASRLPYLNEVSIGHALISDALYLGIDETIRRYRACLAPKAQ